MTNKAQSAASTRITVPCERKCGCFLELVNPSKLLLPSPAFELQSLKSPLIQVQQLSGNSFEAGHQNTHITMNSDEDLSPFTLQSTSYIQWWASVWMPLGQMICSALMHIHI